MSSKAAMAHGFCLFTHPFSARSLYYPVLLGLLLLAMVVRLGYWHRAASYGSYYLSMDSDEYYRGAVLFSQGQWLRDPVPQRYTRGPGYPLFIAAVILIFGSDVAILLLFQVFVSVLTVVLIYLCARRALGRRAALAAAALMAVAPGYASAAATDVMSETLFVFAILLFLYLFWRGGEERFSWPRAVVCGLILGYAALIRPEALEFFPVAALWLLWRLRPRWRFGLGRAGLVMAGLLLIILPYTLRNSLAYQRLILIDTASAFTLWYDHTIPADNAGISNRIENPGDRQNLAYTHAVHNILADPAYQVVSRGVTNLVYLWHLQLDSYAVGAGRMMDVLVSPADFAAVLLDDLFFIVVTLLAIAGLANSRQRPPVFLLLWLGYSLLVVFGTHSEARLRLPFYFVLIIMAGGALASIPQLGRSWSRRERVLVAGAALVFLACAYSPRLAPLFISEYHLARGGDLNVPELQAAVDSFPTYLKALDRLGDAFRQAGQFDRALAEYGAALKLNPSELQAQLGRLDILKQQGQSAHSDFKAETASLEGDVPAPLWSDFEAAPNRRVSLGNSWSSIAYARNFYPVEHADNRSFRWTRERSFVRFNGVQQFTPRHLVLYGRASPLPGQPAPRVSVYINGSLVGQVTVGYDWDEYALVLGAAPRDARDWIVELRSPVFMPSQVMPDSTDQRELGVMLSWAELRE
jgi:4-amino-4-deoxy-L-arabinose transferase-like glycosyltransferase